jgi:hypothetical protein
MTPAEYLTLVKERLVIDPVIDSFRILRERETLVDAYLRARLTLIDASQIEFAEYVQFPAGKPLVTTYSYHWTDEAGTLIRRWDNTPHFPEMPGFPHHVHTGPEAQPAPASPADIFTVLDEVSRRINRLT